MTCTHACFQRNPLQAHLLTLWSQLFKLGQQLLQVWGHTARLLGARDDPHHMSEASAVEVRQRHVCRPASPKHPALSENWHCRSSCKKMERTSFSAAQTDTELDTVGQPHPSCDTSTTLSESKASTSNVVDTSTHSRPHTHTHMHTITQPPIPVTHLSMMNPVEWTLLENICAQSKPIS